MVREERKEGVGRGRGLLRLWRKGGIKGTGELVLSERMGKIVFRVRCPGLLSSRRPVLDRAKGRATGVSEVWPTPLSPDHVPDTHTPHPVNQRSLRHLAI